MTNHTSGSESPEELWVRRAAEEAYLTSLEGATIDYHEKSTVTLVRLSDVHASQDLFRATATPTGPRGLRVFPRPRNFGTHWANFYVRPGYVAGGAYANWTIHTEPTVIPRR